MAEIFPIDEQTWRIEDDFVRFFLLEGENLAVLLDSGVNCPNAADIASSITNKPIILVNTHGDGDHTSGTKGFSEIWIHPDDYLDCEINTKYPGVAMKPIHDGDIIELGERPLKIIHIPGHTKGSIAVLDAKKRVLYAGDTVQKGHIYMFGSKREPEQFEASLDKLISLENEYDRIFSSHDECVLPGDYVRKVKSAWKRVCSGELSYEEVKMHGMIIKSYTAPDCGFYF